MEYLRKRIKQFIFSNKTDYLLNYVTLHIKDKEIHRSVRNYISERFDRVFPLYVLKTAIFFISTLISTLFMQEKNTTSFVMSVSAVFFIFIWTIVRKTSAKRFSSILLVFQTVSVSTVIFLAYLDVLQFKIREYADPNRLLLEVISSYICMTGVGSYDFKVNLFI